MSVERIPQVAARRVETLVGPWPPVLAWGAGLLLAGLGAGAVVAQGSPTAARVLGLLLATAGLATLGWGAVAMRQARIPAPRAIVALSLGGVIAASALLFLSPRHTSVAAVAVTILLFGMLAVSAIASTRHPRTSAELNVWSLLLAAALIAVLVTPALASVQESVLLRLDGTLPVIPHH